jgi:broad specificity phosphatase PhoE
MIWLARHGETTWNLAGRYQGRMESALSALGMQQAVALADAFFQRVRRGEAAPERIISSPMLRCAATALVSADRLGVAVETDDRLIEIAHGTWDGRYRDDLAREDPARYRAWHADPANVTFEGGESLGDVRARWRSFAEALVGETRHTLVVTHDAVIRCALVDLLGKSLDGFWDVRVENAAFAVLAIDGSQLRLIEECATAHLASARADATAQAL